jgi:serine/threonine-protein kinase
MNMPRYLGEGDRYRIDEQIGRGGMGAVYRAHDKNTDRQVAVKIILDVSSPDAVDLFDKEWRILSELQHVNVVGITDRGEFRDGAVVRPYFVMPFLRGKTLQQRIADASTPITVEEVVEIISAAAAGLNAAHVRGVVHRDVKPSNIFTLDSGSVVVIDFGVVHFSERAGETTIKGTTPYIAPELIDPDKKDLPSARSDIFSLGVVCYEALTRVQPFSRDTTSETMRALLKIIPVPAYELNRDVSLTVSQVVQKALAKNKNHRYATVTDFASRLQRAMRNELLPEFDKAVIDTRLKVVKDAFEKGQVTAAQDLLRGIEEEGFVDPAISAQRQKIDAVLEGIWIGQQLESVRLHREVGDFDAALEKLDAILKTAPGNAEAVQERELINTARLKRVLSDANRHMRSHDFESARKAIAEARKIEPKDSSTTELLLELTRLEEADRRLAEQKETLFLEAQAAIRSGSTTTALHKLDRLRDLIRNQGSGSPSERDAIYEQYHDEILADHTRTRRAFEEAKQQLERGKFAQVLAVCDQMLAMNPGHPLFIGMKLQAEDRERQMRLECVEGVCATLANVPDLERRIGILQDALNRFPGEPQLTEMLRNVKGRRDLVGALLASARKAEESGEYISALDNWEAIREFHPTYPGLDREVARIDRRRHDQIRTEKKTERIEEVERLVRLADYDQASAVCRAAVAEFPGDAEMSALLADVTERATRANEARNILAKSRELARAGRGEEMLSLLRRAHALDRNNQDIRQFLGVGLLDRAQAVLETDWAAADQLLGEAQELIPNDPAVKSIATLVADRKQRDAVERVLADARRRALDGDTRGAVELIDQALKSYPNDRRLTAERTKLTKHLATQPTPTPVPKQAPVQEQARAAAAPSPAVVFPEPQRGGGESIFQVGTTFERSEKPEIIEPPPAIKPAEPVRSSWSAKFDSLLDRIRAIPAVRIGQRSVPAYVAAAAAALIVIVLIGASWAWIGKGSSGGSAPKTRPQAAVTLNITTVPERADVLIDGQSVGVTPLTPSVGPGDHDVKISLPGYEPVSKHIPAGSADTIIPLKLAPKPLALRVNGAEEPLTVSLDSQAAVDAKPGEPAVNTSTEGDHSFKIVSKAGESTGTFRFEPGEPPKLSEATVAPGQSLVALGTFGGKAAVTRQGAPATVKVDDQDYKLTDEGANLQLAPGPHRLTVGAQAFPFEVGSGESRHELTLVYLTPALVRPPPRPAADWRSSIQELIAKKRYVDAYAVVQKWLQSEPGNNEAKRRKTQLEWIRDNDPDSWK